MITVQTPRYCGIASLATGMLMLTLTWFAPCRAQSNKITKLEFLDGRGSVDLPTGEIQPLEDDSLAMGMMVVSGFHRYYFRSYAVKTELSAGDFLDATSRRRMETASSDVTVNLDRIVCAGHNGVDLTHWMWHPTAKPQGLLLSKDRMFILENLFILMTVEGDAAGIMEPVADEFLNSVRYLGEAICMN